MIAALLAATLLGADGVAWEKDYAAALTKAKERGVPVLVCFNMDGESANEEMVKLYREPEFVKRSLDFVCLVASAAQHNPEASTAPCPRFGGVSCAEHRKVEVKASAALIGKDEVIAPQHVLLAPDGKVLMRRAFGLAKDELLKMMKMAEKALKTGVSGKELEQDAETVAAEAETRKIEDLIKSAKDHNAERRKPAISALGQIDDLRARDALIALLDPKNMDDTKADALDALATKGNYDAMSAVVARLSDTNTVVVRRAIATLRCMELPGAIPPLTKMWKKKLPSLVAGDIPAALVACGSKNPEVAVIIKKACASADSIVQQNALAATKSLPADPEITKILDARLGDDSSNIRGIAAWVVGMRRERTCEGKLQARLANEVNMDVKECMSAALRSLKAEDGAPVDAQLEGMLWHFTSSS